MEATKPLNEPHPPAPNQPTYPAHPQTLQEAVERYLVHLENLTHIEQYSAGSLTTTRRHLTDMVNLIGPNAWLSSITGERLDQLVIEYAKLPDRRRAESLENKNAAVRSAYTRQGFMAAVRSFLAYSFQRDWVIADPSKKMTISTTVRAGTPVNRKRKSLSLAQAQALLEVGPGPYPAEEEGEKSIFTWHRDQLILYTLVTLGLRASELNGLRIVDVQESGSGLSISVIGKGNIERTIPLPRSLAAMWAEYVRIRDSYIRTRKLDATIPWVFISTRGNRLSTVAVNRIVDRCARRVLEDAEVSGLYRELTPHALRHTAATLLLAAGWDLKVVSKILGHSSVAVTSAYLDELPGELEEALRHHPALASLSPAD